MPSRLARLSTNALVWCGLALVSTPLAHAEPETRVLAGTSAVVATDPAGDGLSNAEIGLSLRADVRKIGGRADLRLDYLGREGFVDLGLWRRDGDRGNSGRHLLRQLSAKVRIDSHSRLTLGRFSTPGDFWLIVNGAKLEIDYAPWLTHSFYGGLRAFTSGFREALITSRPTALALAGSSLDLHTGPADTQLLFTWAMDRLDFSNQLAGERLVLEPHVVNGYFLQASTALRPTSSTTLVGGSRLGTRYDMQFDATTPFGATRIGSVNLGSLNTWLLAELAPERFAGRLRLQYQWNLQRISVFQSELIGVGPTGKPVDAADGNFQDHSARVVGMLSRTMRGELAYRLRLRQNGNREHHAVVGLRDSKLWGNFGYVGSLDVGVIRPATIFFAPEVSTFVRVVYAASATYIDSRFDARLGFHYIDSIGSSLLSSQFPPPGTGTLKTQLFPYALETDRVLVESLFYTGDTVFCGVDLEESTVSWQLRALAQVGIVL